MPFASALRVLIVDDQLTSRLLIRGGLQDLGVTDIEMASNGEEGFNLMKSKPAHLVISSDAENRLYSPHREKRQGVDRARHEARRQQCYCQAIHDASA